MRVTLAVALLAATVLAGCAGNELPNPMAQDAWSETTAVLYGAANEVFNASNSPTGVSYATGFSSFEPTIGVTAAGNLFMSNSEGMAVLEHSSIVRSRDQGVTWEDVTPKLGPVSSPPTSTDPYIHVDQDTNRVYNLDMEGLNCNYIQWSDDEGESFVGHPLGCGAPPVLDHPTLFTGKPRVLTTVGYDNIVYLCVNRVADLACATSIDGGIVFSPFKTVFPEVPPNEAGAQGSCGGLTGHGTTGPEGRAYIGRIHCGQPIVAMSDDDGLTWQTSILSVDHDSIRHDVEVAVDAAGNVYALWVGPDDLLFLAVSKDFGASWSEPVIASAPGINTAVFPAIAAGDEGRAAFIYIGTESDTPMNEMGDNVTWNAYLVTVMNGADGDPSFASAMINDLADPIARGPCDDDNRCNGIGDFIDIVIDAHGRPWAGLVDVCHEACDEVNGNDVAIGTVGTLVQGKPLRGDAGLLPPLDALRA